MNIEIKEGGHVTIVEISGSVDSLTAEALMDALAAEVGAHRVRLVADFSGVEYTSSAGLRALVSTLKDARRLGGDLRLAAVRPAVRKVLELSGFTSILKIFADVPAAVASFVPDAAESGARA